MLNVKICRQWVEKVEEKKHRIYIPENWNIFKK